MGSLQRWRHQYPLFNTTNQTNTYCLRYHIFPDNQPLHNNVSSPIANCAFCLCRGKKFPNFFLSLVTNVKQRVHVFVPVYFFNSWLQINLDTQSPSSRHSDLSHRYRLRSTTATVHLCACFRVRRQKSFTFFTWTATQHQSRDQLYFIHKQSCSRILVHPM